MAVLIAAVVLVGLLGVVNLLFSFGVVRRLREHTAIMDGLSVRQSAGGVMLAAGDTVTEFDTRTVDGERVSRDDLVGTTLVGVFSPGCSACEAQLGRFVEYAGALPGGRGQALAVVVGEEADSAPYVERLGAAARVVLEASRSGPVSKALAVRGFPAFALVEGDLVRHSGFDVDALSAAVG